MSDELDETENQSQGKEFTGTVDEMNDRDAMLKAAEAAMKDAPPGEESDDDGEEKSAPKKPEVSRETDEEPEKDESDEEEKKVEPKPKAKAKDGEAEKKEEPLSKLAREIRARENARKLEAQVEERLGEANSIMERAKGMWNEVQSARQQLQKEMQELAAFKKDPIAAMQKFGWTPEQFIDAATRSKDPAYQDKIALEDRLAEERAARQKLEEKLDALYKRAESYEEERGSVAQQQATQRFFQSIPQDSPARVVWDDSELVSRANQVGEAYQKKTGRVASPEELGEYLHYEAQQRLRRLGAPAEHAGQQPQNAGKVKANGSRALSARDASERHGGAKQLSDMSGDEERAFLIRVAEEAVGRT
jgi:hypothetical protein